MLKDDVKPEFVKGLGMLLALYCREQIRELKYHRDSDGFEAIEICFEDGTTKTVNVTGDSVIASMLDVAKALL